MPLFNNILSDTVVVGFISGEHHRPIFLLASVIVISHSIKVSV